MADMLRAWNSLHTHSLAGFSDAGRILGSFRPWVSGRQTKRQTEYGTAYHQPCATTVTHWTSTYKQKLSGNTSLNSGNAEHIARYRYSVYMILAPWYKWYKIYWHKDTEPIALCTSSTWATEV